MIYRKNINISVMPATKKLLKSFALKRNKNGTVIEGVK